LAVLLGCNIEKFDILANAILLDTERSENKNQPWIPEFEVKIKHYNFPHPGVIIKKDFYEANGYYNENFKIVSDAIFAIENFPKAKCFINKAPLVLMSSKGISNKVSLRRTIEKIKCILFYYKFPIGYKIKSIFSNLKGDLMALLGIMKNRIRKAKQRLIHG